MGENVNLINCFAYSSLYENLCIEWAIYSQIYVLNKMLVVSYLKRGLFSM